MRSAVWMIVILGAALAGCGKSEPLKELSSAEIEALIKGNTAEAVVGRKSLPFRQYFAPNGTTIQMYEGKRVGKWRMDDNNRFCVQWTARMSRAKTYRPKSDSGKDRSSDAQMKERCYAVMQDSQGAYRLLNVNQKHVLTLQRIVPGNPKKM